MRRDASIGERAAARGKLRRGLACAVLAHDGEGHVQCNANVLRGALGVQIKGLISYRGTRAAEVTPSVTTVETLLGRATVHACEMGPLAFVNSCVRASILCVMHNLPTPSPKCRRMMPTTHPLTPSSRERYTSSRCLVTDSPQRLPQTRAADIAGLRILKGGRVESTRWA